MDAVDGDDCTVITLFDSPVNLTRVAGLEFAILLPLLLLLLLLLLFNRLFFLLFLTDVSLSEGTSLRFDWITSRLASSRLLVSIETAELPFAGKWSDSSCSIR